MKEREYTAEPVCWSRGPINPHDHKLKNEVKPWCLTDSWTAFPEGSTERIQPQINNPLSFSPPPSFALDFHIHMISIIHYIELILESKVWQKFSLSKWVKDLLGLHSSKHLLTIKHVGWRGGRKKKKEKLPKQWQEKPTEVTDVEYFPQWSVHLKLIKMWHGSTRW